MRIVKSAIMGDSNLDGMVDAGDLGILGANYKQSGTSWAEGDFNGDGISDVGDLSILGGHYGERLPEPGTLFLLVLGGLALVRRRRKSA